MNIDEIYDLFIWDSSYSEEEYDARESKGIAEARKLKNLYPFIQPIVIPRCKSKSVWEPCAKVISLKSNAELKPYLYLLFEWLQDMNWPGADIIFERLSKIPFSDLEDAYEISRFHAEKTNDAQWLMSLDDFRMVNH